MSMLLVRSPRFARLSLDSRRCLAHTGLKHARLVDPSYAVAHPMHLNAPGARAASVVATPAEVVGATPRTAGTVRFRPCIDLHKGKVKQIVGSTLQDPAPGGLPGSPLITNFESEFPSSFYAELYKHSNLPGGHVVMLGADDKSRQAAFLALLHFPGGLQVGGGVTPENAARYLDAGASHVIVTSYVFRDGRLDEERLQALEQMVGKEHLVLDLSCRKRDGQYFVVTDRWQKFSNLQLSEFTLASLAHSCDEFLVHGVDVEGKKLGIDEELVSLLGQWSPIPVTYAGGARTLDDLERVKTASDGRVDITVGSALDIFGGDLAFQAVVDWHRQQQQ